MKLDLSLDNNYIVQRIDDFEGNKVLAESDQMTEAESDIDNGPQNSTWVLPCVNSICFCERPIYSATVPVSSSNFLQI